MRILLLFILLHCFDNVVSQDLVGIWKGSYSADGNKSEIAIGLRIELDKDSLVAIRSFTLLKDYKGRDFISIYKVKVLKHKNRILNLEEIDSTGISSIVRQRMFLKYRKEKNREILEGNWSTASGDRSYSGLISFIKLSDQ
jgi:hypothetical protein